MQYKVLKIEEDMDFGCEERQPGEALMSVVLMDCLLYTSDAADD